VCTLRVRDQAKQAAHTRPPIAVAFQRDSHLAIRDPKQENNQGIPGRLEVPQTDPPMTRLHNSDKKWVGEKVTNHMRVKKCKNIHKTEA
jgi:hypothetical protein